MDDDQAKKAKRFPPLNDIVDAYVAIGIQVAGGNLTEAAKLLGVGRATLYRRAAPGTAVARYTRAPRDGTTQRLLDELRRRVDVLREATDDAVDKAEDTEHALGQANGLLRARHIMEGRPGTPNYL